MSARRLIRYVLPRPVKRLIHHWLPSTIAFRRGIRDRMRVSAIVHARVAGAVQRGPFSGMRIGALLTDTSAKALGSYEQELHEPLERLLAAEPARIVNVGSSDGYYAVGCKLRVPAADVYAFDRSKRMQGLASSTADLNDVRVTVGGELTPARLETVLAGAESLVICDCEGCEYGLLDPGRVPSLSRASLLVELHDEGGSPEAFVERFRATHHISLIESEEREPDRYTELEGLTEHDRALAVFERPTRMVWGVFVPMQQERRR